MQRALDLKVSKQLFSKIFHGKWERLLKSGIFWIKY
jgi:hypothetical protein